MKSFLHFRYYDLCLRPYFWFISFTDSFKDPAFDFFFFTRCFWFCRFLIHASFLLSFPRWRPRLLISVLSFLSYINYIDEFPLNYCVFCSLHFSFYWKLIFSYPIILSMSSPDLPPLLSQPSYTTGHTPRLIKYFKDMNQANLKLKKKINLGLEKVTLATGLSW